MFVQVACLARLGNGIKLDAKGDPFTVSTIYIDDQLCAKWYFMYQPNASDTAVGLTLQEAVHYLRLGRYWNTLPIPNMQTPTRHSNTNPWQRSLCTTIRWNGHS